MSRIIVILIAFVVMCRCGDAFLVRPSSMIKTVNIQRSSSSSRTFVRQSDKSDADVAADKEKKLLAAKSAYEEKMLKDAMQVTKNQQAFFSVGKFLLPAVILLWIYGISSGGVLDLGVGINQ